MRILVADFAGHPFQYELSTELARAGNDVTHSYCASLLTPQAAFDGNDGPRVEAIDFGRPFEKYSLVRRALDEFRYGFRTSQLIRSTRAERLITSNMPVLSLIVIWVACRMLRVKWLLWLQDLQAGLAALVRGQPDLSTRMLGLVERFLIRRADGVVVISEEFADAVQTMGVKRPRLAIIENWAPLDQLPLQPRSNDWAIEHELTDRVVFLYSGTLGAKHSPHLLLELADAFRTDTDVRVVVVAEGAGADLLAKSPRPNLTMLPFQPFECLPDVMATADILVALLDSAAGGFSVPSKVLSYLCAGRAVLAAIPEQNAAARLIASKARAGVVVDPSKPEAFVEAARSLRLDPSGRAEFGKAGRAYAETNFDRGAIAAQFEQLLNALRTP